jgi:RNA polymerase sigma-70 factor (ECF subfamily)
MVSYPETFENHRPQLFGIAYRMLGSAMEAEDIVQDAYLRYQQLEIPPENPAGYLRKIVTNLSLDYLKSAKVKREEYIGEWIPEPIVTSSETPADELNKSENISVAFLVMLETLSPLERAVFLLREVFDYEYGEIAQILDKSETACRQLYSRAKKHVQNNRPRFNVTPEAHTRLVTHFMAAIQSGNVAEMTNLLAQDVTLYSDGGGKVPAAIHPLHGREKIMAFLAGLQKRARDMGFVYQIEPAMLNGEQGLIGRDVNTGKVFLAATFEVHREYIVTIRFVRNPDKLEKL